MLDRRLAKFQLSLARSNWSPFWIQVRYLLPAQPPFLLSFPSSEVFPPRQGAAEENIRDEVSGGHLPLLERADMMGHSIMWISGKGFA